MALQEISERAAQALGGAKAVVEHLMKTKGQPGARIVWDNGLVQTNYRMGEMGCPALLPDTKTAAEYLKTLGETGYFVVLTP